MSDKTKTKSVKGSKQKQTIIDEYQLRRQIRDCIKMNESMEKGDDAGIHHPVEKPKYLEDYRIGGIDGGGTHSTLIVMDGQGKRLAEIEGPGTNHWLVGMEETVARINAMIEKSKEQIKMTRPLDCIGLSLTGCAEESTNNDMKTMLLEKYPNATMDCVINLDTTGSLRTALESGGIVLIAGTGSNALLVASNGETYTCGGWGHMMGDEGSAYWIASRLCKYVFDDMDGLIKAPHEINWVWLAIQEHFNIKNRNDLLPHFYTDFDKSHYALLTKQISIGCEKGDALCLYIFEEAGKLLAKHIQPLSIKAENDLKLSKGGLKVVCVGSVWKSWNFLKKGFVDEIHKQGSIDELSLLRLITSSAIGACYLASEKLDCSFVKSYNENSEIFFHYNRKNYPKITVD